MFVTLVIYKDRKMPRAIAECKKSQKTVGGQVLVPVLTEKSLTLGSQRSRLSHFLIVKVKLIFLALPFLDRQINVVN